VDRFGIPNPRKSGSVIGADRQRFGPSCVLLKRVPHGRTESGCRVLAANAGPRVPRGGVTLKRRCTHRPSVIYLIVNKLGTIWYPTRRRRCRVTPRGQGTHVLGFKITAGLFVPGSGDRNFELESILNLNKQLATRGGVTVETLFGQRTPSDTRNSTQEEIHTRWKFHTRFIWTRDEESPELKTLQLGDRNPLHVVFSSVSRSLIEPLPRAPRRAHASEPVRDFPLVASLCGMRGPRVRASERGLHLHASKGRMMDTRCC
jgi:hypothetical protein